MADMNNIGVVAKALMKFVDTMNNYELCYHNLEQISDICPDIKEHVALINSWRKNEVAIQSTLPYAVMPEVEVKSPPTSKHTSTTNTTKPSQKITRNRLGGAKVVEIAQLIADKYDDKKVDVVVSALAKNKKYKYDERAFRNLVKKVTYVDLTNPYFIIENGKIVAVPTTIPDKIPDDKDSIKMISSLLKQNEYDVIKSISDDMSPNDILKIAMVRLELFEKGEIGSLGGGVKEIFIMDALSNNKRANTDQIISIVNQKYNISVDVALVSAVRTGRAYKEIFNRFRANH